MSAQSYVYFIIHLHDIGEQNLEGLCWQNVNCQLFYKLVLCVNNMKNEYV